MQSYNEYLWTLDAKASLHTSSGRKQISTRIFESVEMASFKKTDPIKPH